MKYISDKDFVPYERLASMDHKQALSFLYDQAHVKPSKSCVHIVDSFYKSYEWIVKRKAILRRDHYECVLCAKRGKVSRGRLIVHHIVPLKVDYTKCLSDGYLIALCFKHHEQVHGRASKGKRIEEDGGEWW